MSTDSGLTTISGYPAPAALTPGYDRHAAAAGAVRTELLTWAGTRRWTELTWSELVERLLAVGRADVPLARLFEGHVDALRILGQADRAPVAGAVYGVWASRSQRTGVSAVRRPGGLVLDGTISFASGTGVVDRALVPVWLDDHEHVLVDLGVTDLPVDDSRWATSAMEVSRSHAVVVEQVQVTDDDLVGTPGFYLDRPAFFPGGVGVAACWAGGAARVADLLHRRVHDPVPDALLRRLGRIRIRLAAAIAVLRTSAGVLDERLPHGRSPVDDGWHELATETRAVVASSVDDVLRQSHRVGGAAGLAFDRDLARAVHDLQLYVLQQNADADDLFLGHATRP